VIAAACYEKGVAQDLMSKLLERMKKMEAKLSCVATGEGNKSRGKAAGARG
jgi:predicted GNAT family acetyltransferase